MLPLRSPISQLQPASSAGIPVAQAPGSVLLQIAINEDAFEVKQITEGILTIITIVSNCKTMAKILLVEDDQDLSMMVKAGLEGERHVVEVAYDGNEAMHLLKTEDYDVVVLDWQLPELSG